jgi:hypothetical protein
MTKIIHHLIVTMVPALARIRFSNHFKAVAEAQTETPRMSLNLN